MGELIAGLVSAAVVVIGSVISAAIQDKTNQDNIEAQEKSNSTNIELANTSLQRKVDDAKAAGLSPLAAINGPATSSVVTQPTYSSGIDISPLFSSISQIGGSLTSSLTQKYSADSISKSSKYSADSLAKTAMYKTDKDFELATRKLEQDLAISNKELSFKYSQLKQLYDLQKEELDLKNKDLLRQMNQTTGDLLYKAAQVKTMSESNKLELKRLMLENRKVSKDMEKHYDNLSQQKYDTNMKTLTSIFGDLTRLLGSYSASWF